MDNPWKIIGIIALILLAASVFFGLAGGYGWVAGSTFFTKNTVNPSVTENAIWYINNNLLGAGESARLVNVTEESGVYRITTEFPSASTTKNIDAYMTKDGKLLFPTYYTLTVGKPAASAQPAAAVTRASARTCADIAKQDTPVLQAFVVSYCPYGTQMQGILADVVAKVPALAKNIRVRYIGEISGGTIQSMHGPTEAAENLRQICIREEQAGTYWNYVSCFIGSKSSDACMKSAGVVNSTVDACVKDPARGLQYASEDFSLSDGFGVTGSPTLVLDNETVSEFDFGGRNPETIKSMLCCGFASQPAACNTTLSSSSQTTGGACGSS